MSRAGRTDHVHLGQTDPESHRVNFRHSVVRTSRSWFGSTDPVASGLVSRATLVLRHWALARGGRVRVAEHFHEVRVVQEPVHGHSGQQRPAEKSGPHFTSDRLDVKNVDARSKRWRMNS